MSASERAPVRALTLDHLVIAVRDLGAASTSYQRLLGRAPSWRGRHPTYGTANVLFRLNNCYIELLAPVAAGGAEPALSAAEGPWRRALNERLERTGEGLYAIALGTDDIDATVAGTRERGLDVDGPAEGEGVDELRPSAGLGTGSARRQWRNARIAPASTRGVRAFFIEHRSPPEALPVAPPLTEDGAAVEGVDHTVIASSDLAGSLALWHEALGIELRLSVDRPGGRTLCFLRFADGSGGYGSILELAGEAEPAQRGDRDLLWGVSYRVGNVERAVARLRAGGVTVSDPRAGNAPGTIVADLKPGFSHDVRTLIIERGGRS
ncbi:MAG: VOC family protein [Dehalococcoidia bacterium]